MPPRFAPAAIRFTRGPLVFGGILLALAVALFVWTRFNGASPHDPIVLIAAASAALVGTLVVILSLIVLFAHDAPPG